MQWQTFVAERREDQNHIRFVVDGANAIVGIVSTLGGAAAPAPALKYHSILL